MITKKVNCKSAFYEVWLPASHTNNKNTITPKIKPVSIYNKRLDPNKKISDSDL